MVYLKFKNLKKQFGYKLALQEASSQIRSGDYIALLGANGAGKTTLLYVLSGLYRRDGGEIFFPDKNINNFRDIYKYMHILSHQSMFYSRLSAWDNLSFFDDICRRKKSLNTNLTNKKEVSIDIALQICGLQAAKHQLVDSFSRGMLQRLSLARMILLRPKLLFLDEPFTGLDRRGQKLLYTILSEKGMNELNWQIDSFILVDHDIERSCTLSNSYWFVENGILESELKEEKSLETIKRRLE